MTRQNLRSNFNKLVYFDEGITQSLYYLLLLSFQFCTKTSLLSISINQFTVFIISTFLECINMILYSIVVSCSTLAVPCCFSQFNLRKVTVALDGDDVHL